MLKNKIIVVGAGPAGMMAAIRAAQLGADVTLLEKNPIPGKKLLLSGKGRCNLTNICGLDQFLARFSGRGEFLRDAFKKFFNRQLMDFFEKRGLALRVERQGRVFPATDKSASVVDVLKRELQKYNVGTEQCSVPTKGQGVKVLYKTSVQEVIVRQNTVIGAVATGRKFILDRPKTLPFRAGMDNGRSSIPHRFSPGCFIQADRVILATGGVSYAFTGSTGDGSKIAAQLGHTITPFSAGLVPVVTAQKFVHQLEGITLKNIRVKFTVGTEQCSVPTDHSTMRCGPCKGRGQQKQVITPVGELLFTAAGISGPLVLTHSAQIGEWLAKKNKVTAEIDLKPGLDEEQLDARLLREFAANARKSLKNTLKNLMPARLRDVCLEAARLDPDKTCGNVSRKERRDLIMFLKKMKLDIIALEPIEEAMVTRGGVTLKQIDPRTMESRIVKGLYFSGEMMDVDADTGGFNLQAAFSTGYLAGESAAKQSLVVSR